MKNNKLYLGELLKRDGYKHNSTNNLILAPVGSGKTYFIMEDLVKRHSGKKLLLVSTTSLKESLDEEKETITTKDLKRRGRKLGDEELHVMTYAELGTLVKFLARKKFKSFIITLLSNLKSSLNILINDECLRFVRE